MNESAQFGITSGMDFAKEFPALSAKLAGITADRTGLDSSDPKNIVSAMHSNVFQTEAMKAGQATDTAAIDRVFTPPTKTEGTPEQQILGGYDAKEQNVANVLGARRELYGQSNEAANALAELSQFNSEEYTRSRLKTLNPTKDIDERILELRMQAFTAEAMLETDPEIMALPPEKQAAAMASKMAVFNNAINTLAKTRATRLAAAEDQISKEVSAKNKQISTMESRVDAIDRQIRQMEAAGEDVDTIASLRIDRAKEVERMNKARSKSGGMTTDKEFAYQALLDDFMQTHGNRLPNDAEQHELKRQAEQISKTPGEASKLRTTVPTIGTENVPIDTPWWQNLASRMTSANPFRAPPGQTANVIKYDIPKDYISARGYGVPLSNDEIVSMRKERADLMSAEKKAAE